MTYESVPSEMKALKNWVLWRRERRGDKYTKVPYTTNGQMASSTDAKTWTKFETVVVVQPSESEGIGFTFDGNGIIGIDLDHAILADGTIDPMFQGILSAFTGTYVEFSPSGKGLHIFVRSKTPPYATGRRKNYPDGRGLEIYSSVRYFTVTGNPWNGSKSEILEFDSDFIRSVVDPILGQPSEPEPIAKSETTSELLSDEDVIRIAKRAKNGDKISRLLSGDITGYPSASEADLSLASMLAFYTKDSGQIWRIMVSSGLNREKWDQHSGYLQGTISVAIKNCKAHYTGDKPKTQTIQKEPRSISMGALVSDAETMTQIYYAERFASNIKPEWKYNVDSKKWLHWNGKIWETDEKSEISNVLRKFLINELRSISDTSTDKRIEVEIGTIVRLNSARGIRDILSLVMPMVSIKCRELDSQPYLINVRNGVLDLNTGILHPHDPDYLMSKICGVDFNPDISCDLWNSHINTIMDCNDNLVRNLQELLGYALFNGNPEAIFSILVGVGRNGKSVTIDTVGQVLGSYTAHVNPACLMDNGGAAGSDRLDMQGARLIIASEPGDTARGRCSLDSSFIKAATGADTISSRRLYCESVKFSIGGLVVLVTNCLPQIRDQSVAMRERVWAIPFDHFIPHDERIVDIRERLIKEGSGIFNWLYAGFKRYQSSGKLKQCSAVSEQTQDYLDDEDPYSIFMQESGLVRRQGLRIQAGELYGLYKTWHTLKNPTGMLRSSTQFGRHMATRFTKKKDCVVYYCGIGLAGQHTI